MFSIACIRPHYLLTIDPEPLIGYVPEWAEHHLRSSKCVVVRRGSGTEQDIPIGIRGTERNQRWAAFCHARYVRAILTPPQLLERVGAGSQAEDALHILKTRWKDRDLTWGPGGSVGFELATGIPVVTPESDLDIVIYADTPISAAEAKLLCDRADNLAATVDIRVETPACGFSLPEYARESPAPILLRMPAGVTLGSNPWPRVGQTLSSANPKP